MGNTNTNSKMGNTDLYYWIEKMELKYVGNVVESIYIHNKQKEVFVPSGISF